MKIRCFSLTLVAMVLSVGGYGEDFSTQSSFLEQAKESPLVAHGPEVSRLTQDHFVSRDGVSLTYHAWEQENEKGAIVFSSGLGETYVKYASVIATFFEAGYSVYSFDLRAQGFSTHQKEFPNVIHVANFEEYAGDLDEFVTKVVNRKAHEQLFYVAHSLGGHIGALYSLLHPGRFTAMAFTAPMFEFQTNKIPTPIGFATVSALAAVGQGNHATISKTTCRQETFEGNVCTHDRSARDQWLAFQSNHPGIAMEITSNSWVAAGFRSGWRLRREAKNLTTPTLIFQATEEHFVKNSSQDDVCRKAAECKKVVMNGAFHEIFFERDEIRSEAIAQTLEWFDAYRIEISR
jgi:lysophospholipase